MTERDRRLARGALGAERRLRVRAALVVAIRAVVVVLTAVVIVTALHKFHVVGTRWIGAVSAVGGFAVLAMAVREYLRPLPPFAGAMAVDRHFSLSGRLASALSFLRIDPTQRSALMDAAIDDADTLMANIRPVSAVPVRLPKESWMAAVLAAVVVAIALVPARHRAAVVVAATLDGVDLTADDLDAFREFARTMDARPISDETRESLDQYNQLIRDLASRQLDRTEAFRRLQALDEHLLDGRGADRKTVRESLQRIAEELKKSELTKPVGESLEHQDFESTERKLKEVAKKIRDRSPPSKEQLEALRNALKKASERRKDRDEALMRRREELKRELLRSKEKERDAGASEEEKSLLKKKERELERLDRETEESKAARRSLERLDRELAKAAEDLMRDLGASADDLDQGAEDIHRLSEEEMTQQQKEELRQKLQELREMLRQQGGQQGQSSSGSRLRRFQMRAQGQGGAGGGAGQAQGEGGDGQQQSGGAGSGDGKDGSGQQGAGGEKGQGQQGQGKQGEVWVLGPSGQKTIVISRSRQKSGGAGGTGQPGRGPGTGHDDHVQGKATDPSMSTDDTHIEGQDTGEGTTRSEVIHGAAERGFASRGYTNVFREYHTVAEEALNKEEVPGGYRFYVRRYFDLIRPREKSNPP